MTDFFDIPKEKIIYRSCYFNVIEDINPVSPGHLLIISRRWCETFFDLDCKEKEDLPHVIRTAKMLIEMHHEPDGYNIGMNCGEAAGQSVNHFHCHVIPRYKGDALEPRGVRYCIPEKGYPDHFVSIVEELREKFIEDSCITYYGSKYLSGEWT
jgi:diadenosine tetraphosphate (Ap4A) HIT family hydrolase